MTHFNDLSKKQKVITIVNNTASIVFSIVLVGFITAILILGDPTNRLVACIATLFCYLVPFFIQWIFRIRICPSLVTIYLVFVTIAAFCGSCLNLNYIVTFMDKIQHFSWGYIACFIGLYILCRTKEIDGLKTITIILMFVGISLATAGIWEVIEFTGDNLFNQTAQGVPVNGVTPVNDAMFDIIVHACGTLIFTIHFIIEKATHKNLGLTSLINDFKTDY